MVWTETHLYGSSRLGTFEPNQRLTPSVDTLKRGRLVDGQRRYELTNHLGNVLVTVNDRKQGREFNLTAFTHNFFEAVVIQATDYFPFGLEMPGRTFQAASTTAYRMGFNGKENDRSGSWSGTQLVQDYGMRLYNPAIGKFLSVDPIGKDFPWTTPYAFAENDVIRSIDMDGLEKQEIINSFKWAWRQGTKLVKEGAEGIKTLVTTNPITTAKSAYGGAKDKLKKIGALANVFGQGLNYAFTGKETPLDHDKFQDAAYSIAKDLVKTAVTAPVAAGTGVAAQALLKKIRTKTPKPSTKKLSDFQGTTLTAEEAANVMGGGHKNSHLAGSTHPVTGVPFDENGYPNFSEHKYNGGVNEVTITPQTTRAQDFKAANEAAGYSETPDNQTWHHHQDPGKMELIDKEVHKKTGHAGGFSKNKPQ